MKKAAPRIVSVGPGPLALPHIAAILIARFLLRPWKRRGLGRAVEKLASLFRYRNFVIFDLGNRRLLKVGLYDAYWIAPILRDGAYEPEIASVLERVLERDSVVVDCGANVGYWSVWASGLVEGRHRIVSIEASPLLCRSLKENASLNDDRFTPVDRAVWSTSDVEVQMPVDRTRHAWGSIATDVKEQLVAEGFRTTTVRTITIDDALARYAAADRRLLVLKIDVEGAEIEALNGAKDALSGNVLVVYEDHARDDRALITKHMIENLQFEVFYCDDDSRVRTIPDVESARISKHISGRGYNFFACPPGSPVSVRLRELAAEN
ncbi:MAG: FkbM family methyltransferase [Actinomycetota bacterium]